MTNDARTNAPHLVLGLCFIALGAALLLDRLGIVDIQQTMAFWPLALVLLGASLIVQAVRGGSTRGQAFPVGGVIWLILIALVVTHVFERRTESASQGDALSVFAMLSGDRRVSPAGEFQSADMTSFMGGTVLDLRQAIIPAGQTAVVDVFALMGGAVIHVPLDWQVTIDTTTIMGGVNDERLNPPRNRGRRGDNGTLEERKEVQEDRDLPALPELPALPAADGAPDDADRPDSPAASPLQRLVVRGFVMMGGLVIKP
jgi:hypothetical protein